MSYNGAGLFLVNSAGQPVVGNTIIQASVFNAFTSDIATALSTAICKDGQTTVTANIPMNSHKFSGLAAGTVNGDSVRFEQLLAGFAHICEFRITLTSGTPVTTADVTNAPVASIFVTPYKGNRIALYDGSNWNIRTSAELTISTASGLFTASRPADVWVYDNAGTATVDVTTWTSDTARATALALQDGVLVKSGDATRRYIGTVYCDSTASFNDTMAKRHVWNNYNRVRRPMRVLEATDTWVYSTATIRQANGAAANQLDFVVGVNEDMVSAEILTAARDTVTGSQFRVGVGLDSTSTFTTGGLYPGGAAVVVSTPQPVVASLRVFPGVGRHFLSWNEYSLSGGVTTWLGDNGSPTTAQSGIHGEVWA